jgi:hypothetical protein
MLTSWGEGLVQAVIDRPLHAYWNQKASSVPCAPLPNRTPKNLARRERRDIGAGAAAVTMGGLERAQLGGFSLASYPN